jgi:hypothetical protein
VGFRSDHIPVREESQVFRINIIVEGIETAIKSLIAFVCGVLPYRSKMMFTDDF